VRASSHMREISIKSLSKTFALGGVTLVMVRSACTCASLGCGRLI
jgi:hypothetical protein